MQALKFALVLVLMSASVARAQSVQTYSSMNALETHSGQIGPSVALVQGYYGPGTPGGGLFALNLPNTPTDACENILHAYTTGPNEVFTRVKSTGSASECGATLSASQQSASIEGSTTVTLAQQMDFAPMEPIACVGCNTLSTVSMPSIAPPYSFGGTPGYTQRCYKVASIDASGGLGAATGETCTLFNTPLALGLGSDLSSVTFKSNGAMVQSFALNYTSTGDLSISDSGGPIAGANFGSPSSGATYGMVTFTGIIPINGDLLTISNTETAVTAGVTVPITFPTTGPTAVAVAVYAGPSGGETFAGVLAAGQTTWYDYGHRQVAPLNVPVNPPTAATGGILRTTISTIAPVFSGMITQYNWTSYTTTLTLTSNPMPPLSTGATVIVAGASPAVVNGTYVLTGVTSSTVSYAQSADPMWTSGGAVNTPAVTVTLNNATNGNTALIHLPFVHDDTSAVQTALSVIGGVSLPCGTSYLFSGLKITGSNQYLHGAGKNCTILEPVGSFDDIAFLSGGFASGFDNLSIIDANKTGGNFWSETNFTQVQVHDIDVTSPYNCISAGPSAIKTEARRIRIDTDVRGQLCLYLWSNVANPDQTFYLDDFTTPETWSAIPIHVSGNVTSLEMKTVNILTSPFQEVLIDAYPATSYAPSLVEAYDLALNNCNSTCLDVENVQQLKVHRPYFQGQAGNGANLMLTTTNDTDVSVDLGGSLFGGGGDCIYWNGVVGRFTDTNTYQCGRPINTYAGIEVGPNSVGTVISGGSNFQVAASAAASSEAAAIKIDSISAPITAETWSGGTTTLTLGASLASTVSVGGAVQITGASPYAVNGTFTVSGVSGTTLSYLQAADPMWTSGGVVNVPGTGAQNVQIGPGTFAGQTCDVIDSVGSPQTSVMTLPNSPPTTLIVRNVGVTLAAGTYPYMYGGYGGAVANVCRTEVNGMGALNDALDSAQNIVAHLTDAAVGSQVNFILTNGANGTHTLTASSDGTTTVSGVSGTASAGTGGYLVRHRFVGTVTSLTSTMTTTGATTNGSPTITAIPSTAGYQVGAPVVGAGVPAGSTILSILSASSIRLTNNATVTATSVALTVTHLPTMDFHG